MHGVASRTAGQLRAPRPSRTATDGTIRDVATNTVFRVLLLFWVCSYLFVSCVPLLTGHLIIGGITFVAGIIFLIPWLLGVVILGALIWLTNPRRP
jgi:hypothetical protein